jgi:hypothetical protein
MLNLVAPANIPGTPKPLFPDFQKNVCGACRTILFFFETWAKALPISLIKKGVLQ